MSTRTIIHGLLPIVLACQTTPEPAPAGADPAPEPRLSLYGTPWPEIVDPRPCPDRATCLGACDACEVDACPEDAARACHAAAGHHLAGDDLDLEAAVELYRRACEGGHLRACSEFGWLVETGRGAERDLEAAAGRYEAACEAGDGTGCLNVGRIHGLGIGVDADAGRAEAFYARAAGRFEAACEIGDQRACVDLGRMYASGRGVRLWPGRASGLFADACDAGYAAGCLEIAADGLRGDGHPDEIDSLLAHLCDHDVVEACGLLGATRLASGEPGKADGALAHLHRACDGGVGYVCAHLGRDLLDDAAREDNLTDALDLLLRACRLGAADGCVVLASFLWHSGLPEAAARAPRYLEKACHLHDRAACARLAEIQAEDSVPEE